MNVLASEGISDGFLRRLPKPCASSILWYHLSLSHSMAHIFRSTHNILVLKAPHFLSYLFTFTTLRDSYHFSTLKITTIRPTKNKVTFSQTQGRVKETWRQSQVL